MTTTPTISSGCSTGHLLLKTTPPIYNQQSAFTRPFALRSGHTKILSAHYLSRFMQHVHPTFPILSGELVARFQHAIDEENEIQSDEMCILYMALAIGAIFPSVDSVTDARVACELWSVVSRAETVNEESINMIRLLILLVLFSLLQDGFGSSWHLEELAVRTCIILGMYRNVPERPLNTERSSIFWTVYLLDRWISYSLGLPVSIGNDEIDPPELQPVPAEDCPTNTTRAL